MCYDFTSKTSQGLLTISILARYPIVLKLIDTKKPEKSRIPISISTNEQAQLARNDGPSSRLP
jgi:hypothetical protein